MFIIKLYHFVLDNTRWFQYNINEVIILSELGGIYHKWCVEFRDNCTQLLGDKYSNPYFISVPARWYSSPQRIMIVGEEGHGEWGAGKSDGWQINDIARIQKFNEEYMNSQIGLDDVYLRNTSPFWNRFRKIADMGYPCVWNNLDKIHRLGNGKCALSERERLSLHSTETKLLSEEIQHLNPTTVVFFGWYGISMQAELPSLFSKVYPKGLGDDSLWKNTVLTVLDGGITYIMTYHPGWGYRHKGYEDEVIKAVKAAIDGGKV